MAFHDDMAHIADVLGDKTDNKTLDYVAQFLCGVARIAHDKGTWTSGRSGKGGSRRIGAGAFGVTHGDLTLLQKRVACDTHQPGQVPQPFTLHSRVVKVTG